MKFYDRYYRNNYEELLTYYPRFYRDVYEMVEILKAHGRVADALEAETEQAYFNNFILTADAATVRKWEGFLGITYRKALSLGQRRSVVIGRISGYGHIGEPEIRQVAACYTENAVAVGFAYGVISVLVDGEVFDEYNLWDTLIRRIPAHLRLDMCIHIRRASRQRLDVFYGGAAGTVLRPALDGKEGGSAMTARTGQGSVPGFGCHTHTRSKLIG